MPFSAFAAMTAVILLVSLLIVSFVSLAIANWFKARNKVRRMLEHEKAKREAEVRLEQARIEVKRRELRLKELAAKEDEDFFEKWERFVDELPDYRSQNF